ncbi:PREDICTED: putative sodium-coupled neutral amino acid transporter 10 isoform X2 [Nelumbo nucifera]|uniref:Sodium-coupled neutral amino acid transporter 10 isoform X2 n=1 Tax=Nelumbo nucifera TaxID=4432 RepID=A0A1U7Z4Z8_NELNU|nr:PREDICTED: putative sodium-coupled neutral amino acid transporter 10 isoform X2 [Nelumbo nucifera]
MALAGEKKSRWSARSPLLPRKNEEFGAGEVGFDGASFSGAVFNLSTSVVGAGIMALPATVKELGLLPGLVMIMLAAKLTETSIQMILRFGQASKAVTYSGLVGDAFGGSGRKLLQVCIVVNNLGLLIVYMIIIGDVLSGTWSGGAHHTGVVEGWFGCQWWTSRFFLLLLTTLLVLAPLISFKRVVVGFLLHVVHPIENELQDPSQIKSIVRTSLALCTCIYVATSFFGYLLFGEQTLDDVLANFDANLNIPYGSLLSDMVRISYCLHLMLVFPVIFFSFRLNVDGLLFPGPCAIPIVHDGQRFISLTVALMSIVFLGANFVPNIWVAFQFTGATAAVSIAFIFPAAVALRDCHGIATKTDTRLSWLMMVLAVSSSIVAISCNLYSIFHDGGGIPS